jgi:hypothetical protein
VPACTHVFGAGRVVLDDAPGAGYDIAVFQGRTKVFGCNNLGNDTWPNSSSQNWCRGVDQDKLVIPEFQRGFKWQTPDIRKLLESLLLDFPIGAALFWRTQRTVLDFRRIEDVQFSDGDSEEDEDTEIHEELRTEEIDFILDGQQRITSIYKIFPSSLAPTEHELESRFKGLRFFLSLENLGLPRKLDDLRRVSFDEYSDPDVVAGAVVEKRHPDLRKEFRVAGNRSAPLRLTDENILQICQQRLWLPLTRSFLENKQSHLQRLRRVVEADLRSKLDDYSGHESRKSLEGLIESGMDRWTDWFTSTFQATLNSKSLTCLILGNDKPEGLARIFETINSTGLSLSVFDLLVARLGTWSLNGSSTNLRKLISTSVNKTFLQRFDDERSLGGTASQQVPRLLALRTGVELKKGEILKTPKAKFLSAVDPTGPGLDCALETLVVHMGVVDDTYLPFKDLIALIGATYSDKWEEVKDRVIAYLWYLCLVEDWDSSTNDKTRTAYRHLVELIGGRFPAKTVVETLEHSFPDFEEVREATSKASIIYRTLMAFNLARRGVDWANATRSPTEQQEDHHLFPRDWLGNNRDPSEDKQVWASLRDSVLNRVFVSKKANMDAKAQTPPNYLNKLTAEARRVLQIPESFLGPLETPIKSESFCAFLRDRYNIMKQDFIDHVARNLGERTGT